MSVCGLWLSPSAPPGTLRLLLLHLGKFALLGVGQQGLDLFVERLHLFFALRSGVVLFEKFGVEFGDGLLLLIVEIQPGVEPTDLHLDPLFSRHRTSGRALGTDRGEEYKRKECAYDQSFHGILFFERFAMLQRNV